MRTGIVSERLHRAEAIAPHHYLMNANGAPGPGMPTVDDLVANFRTVCLLVTSLQHDPQALDQRSLQPG
jgi:hypothetical protein